MPYIIGKCTVDEIQELRSRGWLIEKAPECLVDSEDDCTDYKMIMIWVDNSMMGIFDGEEFRDF